MCLVFVGFSGPILFRALGIMGTRAVTSAGDFTVSCARASIAPGL